MPTFKFTIAYDGTKFSGWQAQPNCRTVQGAFQETWQKITGEEIRVTASSRTDAGVHATGQVVGLTSATHLTADQLQRALNALLPLDILVVQVENVAEGFHATYAAVGKRYRYRIHNARSRPLFERNYVWHVPKILDSEVMQRAAQVLVGTHDFCSFQSAGSERKHRSNNHSDGRATRDRRAVSGVGNQCRGKWFPLQYGPNHRRLARRNRHG